MALTFAFDLVSGLFDRHIRFYAQLGAYDHLQELACKTPFPFKRIVARKCYDALIAQGEGRDSKKADWAAAHIAVRHGFIPDMLNFLKENRDFPVHTLSILGKGARTDREANAAVDALKEIAVAREARADGGSQRTSLSNAASHQIYEIAKIRPSISDACHVALTEILDEVKEPSIARNALERLVAKVGRICDGHMLDMVERGPQISAHI